MTAVDLWGDIPLPTEYESPIKVLREQADLISQKTNGRIQGKIITSKGMDGGLYTSFVLHVPYLDDYRVHLLTLRYGIGYFPINVFEQIGDESERLLSNMEEFKNYLSDFLQSSQVRTTIVNILTHIEVESNDLPF